INIEYSERFKFVDGRKLFRVRLRPRGQDWIEDSKGASLAGLCNRRLESPSCRVLTTHLRLEKTAENEAAVWRTFDVDARLRAVPAETVTRMGLAEQLERLAETGNVQRCQVNEGGQGCQLDELKCVGFNERQSTLPIAKNGGTWVSNGEPFYSPRGR